MNGYVLGDNAAASQDSRYFGGIEAQQIEGQVKMILLAVDQRRQLVFEQALQSVN